MRNRLLHVACAAAALALPGPALASDAYMWSEKAAWLDAGAEDNDVTIDRVSDSVRFRDRGRYIWSSWGWFGTYGCWTPEAGDYDGTFPAFCESEVAISSVYADVRSGNDRVRIGAALPPVYVYGGAGNDQIDTRNGKPGDYAQCGDDVRRNDSGLDWRLADPGDHGDRNCETVPLGGVLQSGLAAASRGPGKLDIFMRGTNDGIWRREWTGSSWTNWGEIPGGGRIKDAPSVVAVGDRLYVFVRGMDDGLYVTKYENGQWLGSWPALGGQLASAPAAVYDGTAHLKVFVRWSDGTLRQINYDISTSAPATGWIPLGGGLTSRPAAASPGHGRVEVFVRGTDMALYQLSFDGSRWGNWESRDGGLTSGPAVTSRAPGMIDVIVRGTDNALYQLTYELGSWRDWKSRGGDIAGLKSDPALVALDGRLEAFVRVDDDSAYQLRLP